MLRAYAIGAAHWLAIVALAIPVWVAAGLLHELTHAAAARWLGELRAVELWTATALWVLPAHRVDYAAPTPLRARLIGLAPLLVGLALLPVWLRYGVPRTVSGLLLLVAWASYTVSSPSDVSLRLARERSMA